MDPNAHCESGIHAQLMARRDGRTLSVAAAIYLFILPAVNTGVPKKETPRFRLFCQLFDIKYKENIY